MDNINEAFKFTFKLLFGECNLELDDLKDYFSEYHYPVMARKSAQSGKPVAVSTKNYCDSAKFVSQDEIDLNRKFEPLGINEVKDIDSIAEAVRERVAYTGNKLFGRTEQIEGSDNCVDSFYVKNSHNIYSSKFVAYSSYLRDNSEYIFGSALFPTGKHLIRVIEAGFLTRCFETYMSATSSDLYCCYSCFDCMNLMFSFNLRAKRNCIGNLELPKERYAELKKKLVSEIREYIEKNKRFYPPFAIPNLPPVPKNLPKAQMKSDRGPESYGIVDSSFRETCKILFGKDIGAMKNYVKFLTQRVDHVEMLPTAFGNKVGCSAVAFSSALPRKRIMAVDETETAAAFHIEPANLEPTNPGGGVKEVLTLAKLGEMLAGVAFYPADVREGQTANVMESQIAYHVSNAFQICDGAHSRNCGHCGMVMGSEWVFGSHRALHSKFCICVYNSTKLTGCFEMEGCTNCTSSMFCHNCENLDNCMFCFNVKSMRYAIANVEVGRERYMEIKQRVMAEIARRLESDGTLPFDIFNLGCCKGGK